MNVLNNAIQLQVGQTVQLKSPMRSSHRHFKWDTGMLKEFSKDGDECKITSVINGISKTFVEYTDNIQEVKSGN